MSGRSDPGLSLGTKNARTDDCRTDLSMSPYAKPQLTKAPGATGSEMPAWFRQFLYSCLLPYVSYRDPWPAWHSLCRSTCYRASLGYDRTSPSISPYYADASDFPRSVTIITCEKDSLRQEGYALYSKLAEAGHKDVVHFEAKGQGKPLPSNGIMRMLT